MHKPSENDELVANIAAPRVDLSALETQHKPALAPQRSDRISLNSFIVYLYQ
jgi:hypothetical protein